MSPLSPRRWRACTLPFLAAATVALQLLLLCALPAVDAAAAVGATGRPIIQLGLMQYFNPAGRAQNYTPGYDLDAMELVVAAHLAVDDINSGRTKSLSGESILSAYELQLDVRNSLYSSTQSVALTSDMLDSHNNPHPPPMLLGLIGYDEAHAAALASQPYQTPVLTSFVSTPSLSATFPNFNRYCPTDQLEAFALLAMFNVLKWRRVGAISNTEGGSDQLVQVLAQYGPSLVPGFNMVTQSYSSPLSDPGFPDVRAQLQVFKDTGVRIILLSAFASDVHRVLSTAAELGMVGPPYAWIGSNQICFDSSTWSDPLVGPMMEGFLCAQGSVDETTPFYASFLRTWNEAYARDPGAVYYIRTPSVSANAYDSVFGAARAMQTVLDLRAACNLSDTGGLGTDMPLSGLIPPDLQEFSPWIYSPTGGDADSGQNVSFTRSTVPTSCPDVCPWLLYQVGQGRVLNKILRTQLSMGATGIITMMESGDRVGDVSFYNIRNKTKARVATVSGLRVYALLLEGQLGDSFANLTSLNSTSLGPRPSSNATVPGASGGSGGARPNSTATAVVSNSTWLSTYDPASFRPTGHFELTSQVLALEKGDSLDEQVFSYLQLDAIRFADGTTTVPLDAPLRVELVEPISRSAWIAILVLTGIVACYNLALLAFQLWYRKHKLIKITAPKMNVVFLCGSMGILVYIVLLGLDSTQLGGVGRYVQLCHAKYAVLAISFSLAFGSLFAKTYRLDAIFNSKHLHVHVVKDRDILLMVLRLILVDILILVVWGAESPFYRSLSQDNPVLNPLNFNELQVPTRESCGSDNFTTYVIAFLVYKGVLLMFGLYLALRVRKIKIATLNDSKWIVMSIYNVTMISVLLIPVSIVVSNNPDIFYLLVSLALLYLVASVLSLLYLPRVLTVCFGVDMFGERATSGGTGGGAGAAGTGGGVDSPDTASSSDALRAEMAKLRLRLTQSQADLSQARKQMHVAGLTLVLEPRRVSHGGTSAGAAASQYQIGSPSPQMHPQHALSPGGLPHIGLGASTGAGERRTPTPSRSHNPAPQSQAQQGLLASPSQGAGGRSLPAQPVRLHLHKDGGSGSWAPVPATGHISVDLSPSLAPAPHAAPAPEGEINVREIIGGATTDPADGAKESAAVRAALASLPGAAVPNSLVPCPDEDPDGQLQLQ